MTARARRISDHMRPREIGALLGASSATASRWIDTGLLKGFRVPGTRQRRASVAAVRTFLAEQGFDPDELLPLATGIHTR